MELIVKAKDIFLEYAGRDILDIEELEIYHQSHRLGGKTMAQAKPACLKF